MPVEHSPQPPRPHSQRNMEEVLTNLEQDINQILNLKYVFNICSIFLQIRNPRTAFPFHMKAQELLSLFVPGNPTANSFTGIIANTLTLENIGGRQVTFHQLLECIKQALSQLLALDGVKNHPEGSWEVLTRAAAQSQPGLPIIKSITGIDSSTFTKVIQKIQVLFEQLIQASKLIKENQRSWTDFYLSLIHI